MHKDIYALTPGPYREALRLIDKLGLQSLVDLNRVQRAVTEESGVVMDVTREAGGDMKDEVVKAPVRQPRAEGDPVTDSRGGAVR